MLYSILGILQWDSCVLWGGSDAFYFVEKCSMTLFDPVVAGISRKLCSTIFVSPVPPYGAGETSLPLPSLGSHWEKDTTRTATRPKQDWGESGVGLELD
jgi:hypothetical protein